ERSPAQFGARRVAALGKSLRSARDPDIARWLSADLIGRIELLCARTLAAHAGRDWITRDAVRTRVRDLVVAAAAHLTDPSPARADLAAIDGAAVHHRVPQRFATSWADRHCQDALDADARERLAETEAYEGSDDRPVDRLVIL